MAVYTPPDGRSEASMIRSAMSMENLSSTISRNSVKTVPFIRVLLAGSRSQPPRSGPRLRVCKGFGIGHDPTRFWLLVRVSCQDSRFTLGSEYGLLLATHILLPKLQPRW